MSSEEFPITTTISITGMVRDEVIKELTRLNWPEIRVCTSTMNSVIDKVLKNKMIYECVSISSDGDSSTGIQESSGEKSFVSSEKNSQQIELELSKPHKVSVKKPSEGNKNQYIAETGPTLTLLTTNNNTTSKVLPNLYEKHWQPVGSKVSQPYGVIGKTRRERNMEELKAENGLPLTPLPTNNDIISKVSPVCHEEKPLETKFSVPHGVIGQTQREGNMDKLITENRLPLTPLTTNNETNSKVSTVCHENNWQVLDSKFSEPQGVIGQSRREGNMDELIAVNLGFVEKLSRDQKTTAEKNFFSREKHRQPREIKISKEQGAIPKKRSVCKKVQSVPETLDIIDNDADQTAVSTINNITSEELTPVSPEKGMPTELEFSDTNRNIGNTPTGASNIQVSDEHINGLQQTVVVLEKKGDISESQHKSCGANTRTANKDAVERALKVLIESLLQPASPLEGQPKNCQNQPTKDSTSTHKKHEGDVHLVSAYCKGDMKQSKNISENEKCRDDNYVKNYTFAFTMTLHKEPKTDPNEKSLEESVHDKK